MKQVFLKETRRSPAPWSRRSPCAELRDADETSEEREKACEVDNDGKHVWVDLSLWLQPEESKMKIIGAKQKSKYNFTYHYTNYFFRHQRSFT
ncbi:hypothetical protein [Granulicella sp. S156]|uniref:hypothetical protein n=1 Tax=Granulicella sp. S156 TaxID=1747224 RepID=UPI001C2047D5|nr:hypothetical protein [Granulicella sp. S156]